MRNKIKKYIPLQMLQCYRKVRSKKYLIDLYNFDKNRFKSSSYEMRKGYTQENLRSKITYQYHSIEKGLSNANFRPGFGKRAFTGLFDAMDNYLELGYSTTDARFQQGISTIEEYVKVHLSMDFQVQKVSEKLTEYKKYQLNKYINTGGSNEIKRSELPDFTNANFRELALNRHSIRDFGDTLIEEKDIIEAIQISTKTPSACNRQSYKTYYIKNEEILREAFEMQGGLRTHGVNLQKLILVTEDRQYMNGPHERNQTYIDGGLFTMSLVYALTYKNIATCILNTNFNLKQEKSMRKLLNIPNSEDLIVFIAIGSFPENIKVAKSSRDMIEDFITII